MKTKTFRAVIGLAMTLAVLTLITPTFAASDTATLRLVQAAPDAPAVDIFVNGQKTASGLTFQKYTEYNTVPGGKYDIRVFLSPSDGQGAPAVDIANYNLNAGSANTLLLAGLVQDKSLSVLPLSDNNWVTKADRAKIRFIHAVPDAPSVDFSVDGLGQVFQNVSFKGNSNYMEVPAGTYTISGKASADGKTVLTKDINFELGKVYSVYAVGLLSNNSLNVVMTVDNLMPVEAPASGAGSMAAQPASNGGVMWLVGGLAAVALLSTSTLTLFRRRN